ncbi:MAG: TonB-dependent receptor [Thermodesulfobacteriota bacterium]
MKRAVIALVAALAWAGIARAGENAHTLDEVVVTSGRVSESKQEVTTHVTVLDEKAISSSSADTLSELLAEQALGHIHGYPGALSSIGVRGFRTETHGNDLLGHVLILVDGRRIGTGNAARIPARNIERVEIVRGPAAVQYGSAAMGGVVNVITKRGEGKPGLVLEGMYGSNFYREGALSLYGEAKGFDAAVSVSGRSAGDYKTGEGHRYLNTGYDRHDAVSLNVGYTPAPGHRIGLVHVYSDVDHSGSPSYLSQNDLDDYTDSVNRSTDLSYEGGALNDLLQWKVRWFEGRDRTTWVEPVESNPDGWDDGIPSQRDTKFRGAQAQISLDQDIYVVTAGADWVDYRIDNTWLPHRTRYENPSGFLLGKVRLLDRRLILSGGLRYDDYKVEVVDPAGRTETDDRVTPRFGAAFMLAEGLKLRANYGEAFVMPGADQLAADYMAFGRRRLGNPDLKPETSRTLDFGIDYVRGAMEASFTYFMTRYKDKIQATSTAGGDNTWANLGEASLEGLEAGFSYDVGALFNWTWEVRPEVQAAYLTKYRDDLTGEDLLQVSDINVSMGLIVSYQDDFWARVQASYWGPQRVEDFESGRFPVPVVDKGGFTVVNLAAGKAIVRTERAGTVSARIEVKNLLDHSYDHVKGYPMPGRRIFGGLEWRF